MARPSKFIWCNLHQQKKVLGSCPKCHRFPCSQLTPKQIAAISETEPLEQILAKVIKRRIATMYFLVKNDQSLEPYHGTLEKLPMEKAAEAIEALQCSSYIVQELTWVPAGKEKKAKVPGAGRKTLCVLEKDDGELSLTEADPAERIEDGAKMYPVDKRFVRQYVPVKVNLTEKTPERSAAASPAKKKAPPRKDAAAR